jgi:hypothetical protein
MGGPTVDEEALASRCAIRLAVTRNWVNRRVETFSFLDADTVRRQMSIDLTLTHMDFLRDGDTVFAPLMMLVKRDLHRLDVLGPEDVTLPVLNTEQNALAVVVGLRRHLEHLLGARRVSMDEEALKAIVVNRDGRGLAEELLRAGGAMKTLLAPLDEVVRQEVERLISELGSSFLLLVPLEYKPNRRLVCKVSYDSGLHHDLAPEQTWSKSDRFYWWMRRVLSTLGLAGRVEVLDSVAFGLCESYHAEVVPAKDAYAAESCLTVRREGEQRDEPPVHDDNRFRPHLRAVPKARGDSASLTVVFQAHRQELLFPLAFSGLLISVVLGLLPTHVYTVDGQTLAALLLVPFALSAYYIRGQDNSYVTRMLRGARLLVLLPLAAALYVLTLEGMGVLPPANDTTVATDVMRQVRIAFLVSIYPTALLTIALVTPWFGGLARSGIRTLERKVSAVQPDGGWAGIGRRWIWVAAVALVVVLAIVFYGCVVIAMVWMQAASPSRPTGTVLLP